MKRVLWFLVVLLLVIFAGITYAQRIVRIGDLPKSDSVINVYQVYGFQENSEGYKITYIDNQSEPQYLYIPAELIDKVKIFSPQSNTYSSNFLIIWKQGDRLTKVEWYKPLVINYKLPNYSLAPYPEKDKEIFRAIVNSGDLVLGTEIGGAAPTIRAPGGNE